MCTERNVYSIQAHKTIWRSLQENCPNKEFFMVHIFQYLDWIRTRITPCLDNFHPVTYLIFRVLPGQLKDPYSNPYDRQNKNIRLPNFNNKKIKDDSWIFFHMIFLCQDFQTFIPFVCRCLIESFWFSLSFSY